MFFPLIKGEKLGQNTKKTFRLNVNFFPREKKKERKWQTLTQEMYYG